MVGSQYIGKQHVVYNIAGMFLKLVFPDRFQRENILPSFEPFLVEGILPEQTDCVIELSICRSLACEDSGKILSDVSVMWDNRFCFYEQEDSYLTTIRADEKAGLWAMKSTKDFSSS